MAEDSYSDHPAHRIRALMHRAAQRGDYFTVSEIAYMLRISGSKVRSLMRSMETDGQVEKLGVGDRNARTWKLLGPVQAAHPGSSSERQSVGKPGHCESCVGLGHVLAHLGAGCADVGCDHDHGPAEPAEPPLPEVQIRPTTYDVTVLPWDSDSDLLHDLKLTVEWRSEGRYCVKFRGRGVWDQRTGWEYESSPSNRTEEELANTRFSLEEAFEIASREVHNVSVMGWTAARVLSGERP